MVSIRLPGLPGFLYKRQILEEIGGLIGKVTKLNFQTDKGPRGKFARMGSPKSCNENRREWWPESACIETAKTSEIEAEFSGIRFQKVDFLKGVNQKGVSRAKENIGLNPKTTNNFSVLGKQLVDGLELLKEAAGQVDRGLVMAELGIQNRPLLDPVSHIKAAMGNNDNIKGDGPVLTDQEIRGLELSFNSDSVDTVHGVFQITTHLRLILIKGSALIEWKPLAFMKEFGLGGRTRYRGAPLTWQRGGVSKRLDRAIGNKAWLTSFPNFTVTYFPRIKSDHMPIFLSLRFKLHSSRGHPFHFLAGLSQGNQIGDSVCTWVKNMFKGGKIDLKLNNALIVLIPKDPNPECFSKFQPISLCSILYKLVLRAKYGVANGILDNLTRSRRSFLWRALTKVWSLIRENLIWSVGDERNIRCWGDPWIPNVGPLISLIPEHSRLYLDYFLSDMVLVDGTWNLELFRIWIPEIVIRKIIGIPPPYSGAGVDRIIWSRSFPIYKISMTFALERLIGNVSSGLSSGLFGRIITFLSFKV
ncbi:hypothetical protein PVK06_026653 [Gossypium arboreum]|uniref:Reverse transcriptase n=1 Tax=Gossypium arboreum TaxID=29729 RepID=A0ABR0NYC2_GOSAR|nr:hypothetical protein PVK06_026653 [Gossypium arboreum]